MVQEFISTIQNKRILSLVKDNLVWKRSSGGLFTVRSYFDILEGDSNTFAPTKMLWNSNVPSKMSFFAWKVWWEKSANHESVEEKGLPLASRCPLCGKAEEDVHHLLIHCTKIWELWGHLLSCVDAKWGLFVLGTYSWAGKRS